MTIDDAVGFLDAASAETPDLPWKLDWLHTIGRIKAIVQDPTVLDQRGLNVCGPAVFFRMWFARNPMSAASFAYQLLKNGHADVGSTTITPGDDLLAQDYSALRTKANQDTPNSMPEDADWMLMSALRDSENSTIDYIGEPNTVRDRLAGMTLPGTVTSWLEATGVYSTVVNNTTVLADDEQSLLALSPGPGEDVAVMVNSGFEMSGLYPTPSGQPAPAPSLPSIPNHYILLLGAVTEGQVDGWLHIDGLWTWGREDDDKWISAQYFVSNYFGPIIAVV